MISSFFKLFINFFKLHKTNAFSFKGRIGRLGYFFVNLIMSIVVGLPLLLINVFNVDLNNEKWFNLNTLIFFCFFIIFCLYSTACNIKRLHDINLSGWWILVIIPLPSVKNLLSYSDNVFFSYTIPFIPYIPYILLLIIKGLPNKNKYGKPPEF